MGASTKNCVRAQVHESANVKTLTVAFAGSPDFAQIILERLQKSRHPCKLVLTQPDRPKGRGRKLIPNAVKTFAASQDLPVLQPSTLKDVDTLTALRELQPDVLVVAAYGLLLPESVLSLPTYGCINVHASLLPRWRGAAPIERAVIAGDKETGVTIMQMEKGLDTGPVYATQTLTIEDSDTVLALEQRLANMGAELLISVLDRLPDQPTPQSNQGICYAHKLMAEDRMIDWRNDAKHIARQVWALAHRMPVITHLDGMQIQITKARALSNDNSEPPAIPGEQLDAGKKRIIVACGTGSLEVHQLQINKGKGTPMDATAARNGYSEIFAPGRILSTQGQA